MYIVIQTRRISDRGAALPRDQIPGDLLDLGARLGVTLRPLHPGTHDPTLAQFLYLEVANQKAAEQMTAQLLQCKSVEAAYLKPADAPPRP